MITSEDINELKRIDPFRPWGDEPEFAVGSVWPFSRHQLRRSLALYAQRSGLVTLQTLKRQLQHITLEMTLYYTRGSVYAKDFLANDNEHFAKEWQENKGFSEYLAYAEEVLFSDERLFGGHATWAKSDVVKQSPVSIYAREHAINMFKSGQLAYKETALGGCASIEPCKIAPLDWLSLECLEKNCKNLVVVESKLRRVIKAQQNRINRLAEIDHDSVEFRIENETLKALLKAQEMMI